MDAASLPSSSFPDGADGAGFDAGDWPSTDEVLAESTRRVKASRRLIRELDARLEVSERMIEGAPDGL